MRPIRVVLVLGILILSTFAKPTQPDAPKDVHGDPLPPQAFARLGMQRFRVGGPVTAVRFLDGGSKILVKALESQASAYDGTYRVFDAQAGKELHHFVAHDNDSATQRVLAYEDSRAPTPEWCVSPDGQLLAKTRILVSGTTAQLQVQELATGKVVLAIEDTKWRFHYPLFSPNGQHIAAIAQQQEAGGIDKPWIRLWDIRAQKEVRDFAPPARAKESFQPLWFAFSPDAAYLAATGHGSGNADRIYVWDVAGQKPVWSLAGQPKRRFGATPVAFSADSKVLATIQGTKFGLWDPATGKQLKEVADYPEACGDLSFSPDGKRLVACMDYNYNEKNRDLTRMWDLAAGKEIELPDRCALGCFFSNDSETLIALDPIGRRVLICNSKTGKIKHAIPTVENSIRWKYFQNARQGMGWPVALSPDGATLVFADKPGQLRRFEVATAKELSPPGFANVVSDTLVFSPDGKKLLAGSYAGVLLHDLDGKQPGVVLPIGAPSEIKERHRPSVWLGNWFGQSVCCLAFSRDGKHAAAGWDDGKVMVWDTATAKLLWQNRVSQATIHSVAFAGDNHTLLSSSLDGRIVWWNVHTGKLQRKLEIAGQQEDRPFFGDFSLRFGPGERTVVGRGRSWAELEEWELATGKLRRKLPADLFPLDYSPNGRTVLVLGQNAYHTVDCFSGQPLRSFAWAAYPQPNTIPCCWARFSPDGHTLAGIANESIIRIWNSKTATVLTSLKSDSGGFRALAFSPNGKVLATVCGDGTILLWRTPTPPPGVANPPRLKPEEMLALWKKLTGDDAVVAGQALQRLAAAEGVMAWLGGKLSARVPADDVSRLGVVELLERIGTKEARSLLKHYADAPAGGLPARAAKAALVSLVDDLEKPFPPPLGSKDAEGGLLPAGARARLGLLRFQPGEAVVAVRYAVDGQSILAETATTEWRMGILDVDSRISLSSWKTTNGSMQWQTEVTQTTTSFHNPLRAPFLCWTVSQDGKLLVSVDAIVQ
jgi:WD40 repeat protein